MKRFEYLDIAKGIGILMVVWGHILITGQIHQIIYAFHMPLFFLISGMLFKRNKFNGLCDFLKRRAKRLLIPFAVYSVITWVIWAIFRFIRHDNIVSYWDPLLQTIIAKGSGAYMVHNSALWFIPCLFATEIIYFSFCKLSTAIKLLISIGCAALSFILGYYFADDWWFLLPWNFDAALIAVLFYCIGNIFASQINTAKIVEYAHGHKGLTVSLFIIFSLLLYWGAIEFGECSMGSSSYQCNGAIFVARALIGIVACILLSVLLSFLSSKNIFKKYFTREGMLSLDIMSIHIPVKGIVIMGLSVVIHVTSNNISYSLAYSIIAFIVTMVIVDFIVSGIQWIKSRFKNSIQNNE